MKATLVIDEAVGERRRVLLDENGRPFRLDIDRWSERGRRALLDQVPGCQHTTLDIVDVHRV